jgi:hypothetical protein
MSHHHSGPDWGFPRGGRPYGPHRSVCLPQAGVAGKSILIMNVHRRFMITSTTRTRWGPLPPSPSRPRLCTSSRLIRTGDAVADIAYRVRFSSSKAGVQTATLRQVPGNVLLGSAVNESAGRVLF